VGLLRFIGNYDEQFYKLASHRPCGANVSDVSTQVLRATERQISILSNSVWSYCLLGDQHWWALAFSGSLPLYLYERICTSSSSSSVDQLDAGRRPLSNPLCRSIS